MSSSPPDPRTLAPPGSPRPATPAAWKADRGLVGRVLHADAQALAEFSRRLACLPPFLTSRNRAMGGPFPEADLADLVQDVLVIVWRRLDSYAGRSALETWACGIANYEFMNALRRHRRRESREFPIGDFDPGPVPERNEGLDLEGLRLAMSALPPDDAALLRLKHHDGLSFPQLGERLKLSTSGAKNRYYRILERLRVRLARSAPDPGEPR